MLISAKYWNKEDYLACKFVQRAKNEKYEKCLSIS